MLFDTSVWIHFLKGKNTESASLLQTSIRELLPVYICPPIYQEILQGIRDEQQYANIKDKLISLNFIHLDSYFEEAAKIYRSLKKKGITIRKPNDCLIAYYAIHFKVQLVHNDRDFDNIALHSPLKIYKA